MSPDRQPEIEQDWVALAKKVYERAQIERARQEAKAIAAEQVRRDRVRADMLAAAVPLVSSVSPPPPPIPLPDGKTWQDNLTKGAAGAVASTLFNVSMVLENDDCLRGTIRWNDHDKCIEVRGGLLAQYAEIGISEIIVGAQNFLAGTWNITAQYQDIARRIMAIAKKNTYDPLADHLRSLKWDGVSRIDTFLITYFGVKDTEHIRRISRRWMLGAVARAFEPGCKFDSVLVFEGLQGEKKSSAFETFGGAFYCSTEINIRDKDAKMLAACSWIIELAEMDSIRRSENSLNKAFLTNRVDKFRPPFGADMKKAPRRCVFVGSTNEVRYFTDVTGNRRYWPVRCGVVHAIDLAALMRDRDQLWAEAVYIFLSFEQCADCAKSKDTVFGQRPRCEQHRWWLSKSEEREAAQDAEEREEDQPWMAWADRITVWWRGLPLTQRPSSITASQIAAEAGDLPVDRISRPVLTEVGIAMGKLGFLRVPSKRCYVPSKELAATAHQPHKGLIALPGGKK